jgi:hypothetical protein
MDGDCGSEPESAAADFSTQVEALRAQLCLAASLGGLTTDERGAAAALAAAINAVLEASGQERGNPPRF